MVPILYDGDPDWYGNLVSQDDGSFLKTNIPFHLEFIGKRKKAQETHFAQVARLVKFWTRKMKQEQDGFRFKSFMVELILAHLADGGADLSDYPEALQHFFTYVAKTNFRERIVFGDYYEPSTVGTITDPVQIIDPVNAANNVSRLYTASKRTRSSMPRSMPATPSMPPLPPRPSRRPSVTGRRSSVPPSRCEIEHDQQLSRFPNPRTFTVTHARHMAAKVATDLKRMQRLYGTPSDATSPTTRAELIELLKAGYLGTVTYGFKRDGNWIEPTLRYTAQDLAGAAANDDDPGPHPPRAPTSRMRRFYSYLTYSRAGIGLRRPAGRPSSEPCPFSRGGAPEPAVNGYFSPDRVYSAGGRALNRDSVRSW